MHIAATVSQIHKWEVWLYGSCQTMYLYYRWAVRINLSSQICPFLAVRPQFDSDHHQNRRLSSHPYSHESGIFFRIFGIHIFKVTASLHFLSLNACCYAHATVETKHCGSVHYIKIGDGRLRTVASAAGLWGRSSLY